MRHSRPTDQPPPSKKRELSPPTFTPCDSKRPRANAAPTRSTVRSMAHPTSPIPTPRQTPVVLQLPDRSEKSNHGDPSTQMREASSFADGDDPEASE
ncbi:hypothetical protein FRB90_005153, partial [Tulasnella sp. 427]